MRLGIVSPVVTAVPGAHSAWERDAGIEESEIEEVLTRLQTSNAPWKLVDELKSRVTI